MGVRMLGGVDRGHPWTLELPADPLSAARARQFLTGAVGRLVGADLRDAAVLVVSELVTNAVRHAGTDLEVEVALIPGGVRVQVSDSGGGYPVAREADPQDERGRGLGIVDSVAARWGVEDVPAGGKRVWVDLRPS
jgi:anti-sigma regulatory factor (Ser/Thr protein kinase)